MQGFLGGVSSPAFESAHVPPQLPLPLSWEERTDYSHSFYSPQSEVGLWAAFTIGHAFSPTHQRATVVLLSHPQPRLRPPQARPSLV